MVPFSFSFLLFVCIYLFVANRWMSFHSVGDKIILFFFKRAHTTWATRCFYMCAVTHFFYSMANCLLVGIVDVDFFLATVVWMHVMSVSRIEDTVPKETVRACFSIGSSKVVLYLKLQFLFALCEFVCLWSYSCDCLPLFICVCVTSSFTLHKHDAKSIQT